MLDSANLSLLPNPFHYFVMLHEETGVAHGDGHSGNVMLRRLTKRATECIDFERSFLPLPTFTHKQITGTISSYYSARTDADRSTILISEIDKQGLNYTRSNFRLFAQTCLKAHAPEDLFRHGIEDFLRVFTLRP